MENENMKSDEFSLRVVDGDNLFFTSNGKWLYPLFDLHKLLASETVNVDRLSLTDKIAGKAAAFLIVRTGIKKVHIKLISEGALQVFERFGLDVTYDELVDAILCKTEIMVSADDDPEKVWQMLRRRAGHVSGVDISIRKIDVRVDNNLVLQDVDLDLKKGGAIVIKGPNGAGKTTLLKSILGIVPIEKGEIEIDGIKLGSRQWNQNRYIVGYVNQNQVKNNFPISVREVVAIGLAAQHFSDKEITVKVESAMRRTQCLDFADRLFFSLSGGEQQRVSIARCLCQQAKLLLLDEPTSFLDSKSKSDLKDLLLELYANEAPTMIVISHDDQWTRQLGWPIYELENGKLC